MFSTRSATFKARCKSIRLWTIVKGKVFFCNNPQTTLNWKDREPLVWTELLLLHFTWAFDETLNDPSNFHLAQKNRFKRRRFFFHKIHKQRFEGLPNDRSNFRFHREKKTRESIRLNWLQTKTRLLKQLLHFYVTFKFFVKKVSL